jgi:hypothetical protein
MSIESESHREEPPANFEDKVRAYTLVLPTPEVVDELRRLAKGEKGSTHFGDDWKAEHYQQLLERLVLSED